MVLDSAKKYLTTTKLITYIIINILKLREIHMRLTSSSLLNKIIILKDITKFGLDIMSFNILNILLNSVSYYRKFRSGFKYMVDIVNRKNKNNGDKTVII
jgi:hypothetical protein